METSKYARHGDLILSFEGFGLKGKLKKIESIPKGAKRASSILALGEFTGHKHVVTKLDKGSLVNVWKTIDNIYVEVKKGKAELTHQEHKPIIFVKGIYEMKIKREYDPFLQQIRTVSD